MYRIFYLLLIFVSLSANDDFDYKIEIKNKDVVVKESVVISVKLWQKSIGNVIHFDFDFLKSNDYEISLMESDEAKDEKGRSFINSIYLLYPLKDGIIKIKPKLTIKKASKGELKKFVTGSADELMYMQTINRKVDLDFIELNVKDIEDDIELIGDYEIKYSIDKKLMTSDQQINVKYMLSGHGYKPSFKTLLKDISHVNMFRNRDKFDKKLFHKVVYTYALKSDQNFIVPEVNIVCYNPKSKKRYILRTPSFKISVKSKNINNSTFNRQTKSLPWKNYLNYLLLFIAGFFIQKIVERFIKSNQTNEDIFINRVKRCKTPKELLRLLLAQNSSKFKDDISKLEMMIYQDGEHRLSTIKSSVIKSFFVVNKDFI